MFAGVGAGRGPGRGCLWWLGPVGGGGAAKWLAPGLLVPNGGPAHGLHPCFVVAKIWADRRATGGVRGGGTGGGTGGGYGGGTVGRYGGGFGGDAGGV